MLGEPICLLTHPDIHDIWVRLQMPRLIAPSTKASLDEAFEY